MLVLTSIWVAAGAAGWAVVLQHEAEPGSGGDPAMTWPAASCVVPAAGSNLVVLVHPRCPCTRASLRQLAALLSRCDARVTAHVLVLAPSHVESGWEETDLLAAARCLPNARVVLDRDGVEAARFGIEVSGHVLFYDARGALQFSGGITGSRGHEGANAGFDAVLAAIRGARVVCDQTPVFGCPTAGGCEQKTPSGETRRCR